METVVHPIPPEYDADSRILILGSFPSVKSRESMFFYGHPQNRFWKTLSAVFDDGLPSTVEEKKAFLHRHHIALWDVIASCEITGSSDSSIRNAVPNDIGSILRSCHIEEIYVNGKTAARFYDRYLYPSVGRRAVCLPSTSPANAGCSLRKLTDAWRVIRTGSADLYVK